jgi:NADH-quinone oxidoreductase subunit M
MLLHIPLLSLLIWLPIIGSIIVLLTGNDRNANVARGIALAISIISMLLCVPLYLGFDLNTPLMQFREFHPWITEYGINYALGVDGISMPMVILTTFTSLIVVLAAWRSIKVKVAQYLAAFLLLQGMMVGVFSSIDSILFYVFWEGMLIPMYICIGVWGMENRSYASIKFFLYTFLGSALMLIALIY